MGEGRDIWYFKLKQIQSQIPNASLSLSLSLSSFSPSPRYHIHHLTHFQQPNNNSKYQKISLHNIHNLFAHMDEK